MSRVYAAGICSRVRDIGDATFSPTRQERLRVTAVNLSSVPHHPSNHHHTVQWPTLHHHNLPKPGPVEGKQNLSNDSTPYLHSRKASSFTQHPTNLHPSKYAHQACHDDTLHHIGTTIGKDAVVRMHYEFRLLQYMKL